MTYAKAVRKITFIPYSKGSIQEAIKWAKESGLSSFCFNGCIWVSAHTPPSELYIMTPFKLEDFEV